MAWTGTYTERITKKLDDLAGAKYTPNYDDQIKGTADQIANYGPYNSNYSKQISTLTNQIGNYGPYNSRYQPQIDSITGRLSNYGDYVSKYQPQIDSLMNQLSNWNYDPEQDVSYQAYKKQYTDLGNRSMRDTLGQVAARTGGLASSYASAAAQQSYNDYMTQLSNIIPQLESQAYNRTNNSLNMYNQADQTDYGRWSDAYNRLYNTGNYLRGLDSDEYGRYRDALQDLYNQQSMYQGLDATDYGRWADALQNLYSQNGMYLNMDANELARYQAGQSDAYNQLKAMQDYNDWEYQMYLADLAAAAAAAGGGGGGAGGYGGYANPGSDTTSEEQRQYRDATVFNQYFDPDQWEGVNNAIGIFDALNGNISNEQLVALAVAEGMDKGEALREVSAAKRLWRNS